MNAATQPSADAMVARRCCGLTRSPVTGAVGPARYEVAAGVSSRGTAGRQRTDTVATGARPKMAASSRQRSANSNTRDPSTESVKVMLINSGGMVPVIEDGSGRHQSPNRANELSLRQFIRLPRLAAGHTVWPVRKMAATPPSYLPVKQLPNGQRHSATHRTTLVRADDRGRRSGDVSASASHGQGGGPRW